MMLTYTYFVNDKPLTFVDHNGCTQTVQGMFTPFQVGWLNEAYKAAGENREWREAEE
jgi:hypothetical protein